MTNILDTVEPDAFLAASDDGECHLGFDKQDLYREVLRVYTMQPLYSRETVESLLEAHRKQVLLEAAERLDRLSNEANEFDRPNGYTCARELRRMAEGERHE
jgi:hypothetical protein